MKDIPKAVKDAPSVDPESWSKLRKVGKIQSVRNGSVELEIMGPISLPRHTAGHVTHFDLFLFRRGGASNDASLSGAALCYGDLAGARLPLVRIHSSCVTGEVFGSLRCDCSPQLERALARVVSNGSGVVVYASNHEGRGVGLWAKGAAYLLQEEGIDTYLANRLLGLPEDDRDYVESALMLCHLVGHRRQVVLLSDNPLKRKALEDAGFIVARCWALDCGASEFNRSYLAVKRCRGLRAISGSELPDSV